MNQDHQVKWAWELLPLLLSPSLFTCIISSLTAYIHLTISILPPFFLTHLAFRVNSLAFSAFLLPLSYSLKHVHIISSFFPPLSPNQSLPSIQFSTPHLPCPHFSFHLISLFIFSKKDFTLKYIILYTIQISLITLFLYKFVHGATLYAQFAVKLME